MQYKSQFLKKILEVLTLDDDCRLLGVTININTCSCCFLNIYLPHQCVDNDYVFVEYYCQIIRTY